MVSFFLESEFLKQEQRQKSDSEREMVSSFWFIFFFESDCLSQRLPLAYCTKTSDKVLRQQQIRSNDQIANRASCETKWVNFIETHDNLYEGDESSVAGHVHLFGGNR